MRTPVALFIYRRPDCTRQVWEAVRRARPPALLVVADGPRDANDRAKCDATRAIVQDVDWPCDVRRNYAEANLGCRRRMASGLDWVFEQVEEAILLEDDCLPDPSFFGFCDELLDRYRDHEGVMHISGDNFQHGIRRTACSYYFSKYPHVWGWATWRRAWRHYDGAMAAWPEARRGALLDRMCGDRRERRYWRRVFDWSYRGEIDTWDFAWTFACWRHAGLAVLPEVNLVSNIGHGVLATHTSEAGAPLASFPMPVPLKHPPRVAVNAAADRYTYLTHFAPPVPLGQRLRETVFNRHFHGAYLRKTPVLGPLWAALRRRGARGEGRGTQPVNRT